MKIEKSIEIATTILNDAYANKTVYYIEYLENYSHKELQNFRVRKLLAKHGCLDWDEYNNMWHSFTINHDGIEFVESKKKLVYTRKMKFCDLIVLFCVLVVLLIVFWIIYIVIGALFMSFVK